MNYSKLNELAAKAMGAVLYTDAMHVPHWEIRIQKATNYYRSFYRECDKWRPATSADDALLLLESVAQGKGYSIYMFPEEKKPYDVELELDKRCTDERTLPLAMTVAALRAAGITESEITAAME